MGVSLLLVFTHLFTFIHTGTFAQMLGHVTFSISYVVVIVRGRLFSIGRQYEEAAADLGASAAGGAHPKVLLPLLTPAIVAGAAICFAISIDDFVISYWLSSGARHRRPCRSSSTPRPARRRCPSTNAIATILSADHARLGRPRLPRLPLLHPRRAPGRARAWSATWRRSTSRCRLDRDGRRSHTGRSGQALRRRRRRRRDQRRHAERRVLLDARAVRLRQDDDAADDRRVRAADRGQDPARRRRHGLHAAAQAQRQHRLPELRALPAPERGRQRRVRPAPAEGRQAGAAPAGRRGARARPADRASRSASRGRCPAASSSGSRSRARSC